MVLRVVLTSFQGKLWYNHLGREVIIVYRTPVKSSRMISVGWEHNILEIEFPDGVIYQYPNVSYPEYQNFIHSESLGSYLSNRIDKLYPGKPINK